MTHGPLDPSQPPTQPVQPMSPYPPPQYTPTSGGPPVYPPSGPPQYGPTTGGPPPYPPAGPMPFYPAPVPPKRKSFWSSTGGILTIVFGSLALVVVFVLCTPLVLVAVIGDRGDRAAVSKMEVRVTSCEVFGSVAKVGFSVKNIGDKTRSATLKIEYRDSAGARLDTTTSYVRNVAPGDTVRGEESTILDVPTTSGSCKIVGVS